MDCYFVPTVNKGSLYCSCLYLYLCFFTTCLVFLLQGIRGGGSEAPQVSLAWRHVSIILQCRRYQCCINPQWSWGVGGQERTRLLSRMETGSLFGCFTTDHLNSARLPGRQRPTEHNEMLTEQSCIWQTSCLLSSSVFFWIYFTMESNSDDDIISIIQDFLFPVWESEQELS